MKRTKRSGKIVEQPGELRFDQPVDSEDADRLEVLASEAAMARGRRLHGDGNQRLVRVGVREAA
jgi:hypothetical protein